MGRILLRPVLSTKPGFIASPATMTSVCRFSAMKGEEVTKFFDSFKVPGAGPREAAAQGSANRDPTAAGQANPKVSIRLTDANNLPSVEISNARLVSGATLRITFDYRFTAGEPANDMGFFLLFKDRQGKEYRQLAGRRLEKQGSLDTSAYELARNPKGPFEVAVQIEWTDRSSGQRRKAVISNFVTVTS
jgi:hypothetical protein